MGDLRLGDANGDDLDAWCVHVNVFLQRCRQRLVERVEFANVHLFQRRARADLIDLVMDLVIDPGVIS